MMNVKRKLHTLWSIMVLVVSATALMAPAAHADEVIDEWQVLADATEIGVECTVGGNSPTKVTGQIHGSGSFGCNKTFRLVLTVCIQINETNTQEGWTEYFCGPPATKTGTSVSTTTIAPCPDTALYRTHVTGQAFTAGGVLVAQGMVLAPSGGTAIACPLS